MRPASDRLLQLQVADVMNRAVISVRTSDSLTDAARILIENGISGAPVLDEIGQCVGVISVSDFVEREHQFGLARFFNHPHPQPKPEFGAVQHLVGDYMSSPCQAVSADMPLVEAALLMCARHIHRLPVLDDAGQLVGIVTSLDMTAAMVNVVADALTDEGDLRHRNTDLVGTR